MNARDCEAIRALRASAAVLAIVTVSMGVWGLGPALDHGGPLRCFGLGIATGGAIGVLFFLAITRWRYRSSAREMARRVRAPGVLYAGAARCFYARSVEDLAGITEVGRRLGLPTRRCACGRGFVARDIQRTRCPVCSGECGTLGRAC